MKEIEDDPLSPCAPVGEEIALVSSEGEYYIIRYPWFYLWRHMVIALLISIRGFPHFLFFTWFLSPSTLYILLLAVRLLTAPLMECGLVPYNIGVLSCSLAFGSRETYLCQSIRCYRTVTASQMQVRWILCTCN